MPKVHFTTTVLVNRDHFSKVRVLLSLVGITEHEKGTMLFQSEDGDVKLNLHLADPSKRKLTSYFSVMRVEGITADEFLSAARQRFSAHTITVYNHPSERVIQLQGILPISFVFPI